MGYEALSGSTTIPTATPHEWFTLARLCGLGTQLQALTATRALAVAGTSGRHLPDPQLRALVSGVRGFEGGAAGGLSEILIEVTEQELISDHDLLADELSALRARGARIALDDTGAGYAGLRHVTLIRPDVIKLDRALVENVHADTGKVALLDSFTSFARRTGAQVCAEGIESDAELDTLVQLRVDLGQGFRLGRPGPLWPSIAADVADRLRQRERPSGASDASSASEATHGLRAPLAGRGSPKPAV